MKAQLKNSFAKCDIFLLLMLLSGVVLRIIYLAEYSANINFDIACGADVREYFDRMTEMISGRFFPEKPDIHGIFYPLFSSLFLRISGSIVLLRILQSVLNFFSFFILYILLGKYRVNLKIRRIFLAISMLYTVQFFHSAEIISESLLVPLITVLLCLLYKVRYGEKKRMLFAGAAGGVAGLAVLTHGSMLLLTLAYPVLLWYEKRKKCAVMMLASLMLLTGAFCAVKSASYGRVCFVQENGAFNFYLGNSKLADGSCRIRPGLEWRKLHANAEKEALERGISKDALFLGRSLHYIFTEPVGELKLLLRKAVLFFHFKELISGADPEGLLYASWSVRAGSLFTLFLMVTSIAGVILFFRNRKQDIPLDFLLLYLAVFAVNVLTVASGRYRIAAYPAIYLFSAYAISLLPLKIPLITAVVSSFTILVFPPELNDRETKRILGEAAFRKNDYGTAYRYLSEIRSENNDPSGVQNMLGAIHERRGEFAEAKKCYEEVIRLEPDRYEAYMNLARFGSSAAESEKLYVKALELAPDAALLNVNYAKFLINTRRAPQAVDYIRRAINSQPGDPDFWNTLAVAYAYSNRMKLALEAFEAAAKLAPSNLNYRRNAESIRQILNQRRELRHRSRR